MSRTSFRDRPRQRRVTLSVTPLIDVLFLLIIFFSVTGTFKRAGELELSLPESETSTPTATRSDASPIELIVTEDGALTVDGEVVALDAVATILRGDRQRDPTRGVLIKAELAVLHGEVVHLLDIVRDVGFPGVSIGTYVSSAGRPGVEKSPE